MYHFKTLKTTIAKAFRDFDLGDFDREVWHLKSLGGPLVTQKHALHYLSRLCKVHFEWETNVDRVHSLLNSSMDGERILLVLNSITENCIDAVRCYVGVELGKMRFILWTARSLDAQKKSNVNFQSLKWVKEEDVLAILVERMSKKWPRHERPVLKCANRCSFQQDRGLVSTFHQLALGRHSSDFSRCLARINDYHDRVDSRGRSRGGDHLDKVFDVLNDAFELFDHAPCLRNYFYHLEKWIGDKDGVDDEFAGLCWLAIKCVRAVGTLYLLRDTEVKLATIEEDIEKIKAKLSSHRVLDGRALDCERAIKEKVEEMKHNYHVPIYELLEIINEKYTEADGLTDGTGEHSPSNDGFQDGLPDNLDHVFRILKIGWKIFYGSSHLGLFLTHLRKWREGKVCVDDVFAMLWLQAIKWGNEFQSLAEEDGEGIANKLKKEIKYIKAKLSSDEVVKWILMSCKKEIKERIEDIKRKNRREFVWIEGRQEKEDEDELRFRDKAVNAIGRLIPPRIRFPFSSMQKETTLNWLEKASTIKGLHVANLYEVAGSEKTVLRQSFYNFRLKGFEDEVTTLEFLEGNSLERFNNPLLYLTCAPAPTTGEILIEDAFFQRPTFNIMILLIKYAIPDSFMDKNLMDIARDFHINWGGNTRMVFHSQMYTIIELSRA